MFPTYYDLATRFPGVRRPECAGDPKDVLLLRSYVGRQDVVMTVVNRWTGIVVDAQALPLWYLLSIDRSSWRDHVMTFLKRVVPQGGKATPGGPFPDEHFARDFPALYEYLTSTAWPDGSPRKTSSLSLFCEDGVLKVCCNDRECGAVLFAAGRTLQDALRALEGLLTAEGTPWRVSRDSEAGKAKKR